MSEPDPGRRHAGASCARAGERGGARAEDRLLRGLTVFSGTYARGAAATTLDARAWLQALLDVEAALARAGAAAGLLPAEAAEAIGAACRAERFDVEALAREAGDHATPVVPLVRALRAAVGPDAAPHVHRGATSQDVLDTASMLLVRDALDAILKDARGAADAAAVLAVRHRDTPMAGRTLLQQARPTTFGLRAAGWLVALEEAVDDVTVVREKRLAVQLGGPVGAGDPALTARLAAELGLPEPTLPWHTNRVRIGALAGTLGTLAGALAKIGRDVALLAQTEVGEVREGGEDRGASSAMAHKRNPVAAVSVVACAHRVPGLVASLLAGMTQELERATGTWQAEWGTLGELLGLTGSAAAWGRDLIEGLEVDAPRMAANLRLLAAAGIDVAPPGTTGVLVDRALKAHRA